MSNLISPVIVSEALTKVTGIEFEKMMNEFVSGIFGTDFSAAGGNKDGGVDGLLYTKDGSNVSAHVQFSTQQNYKDKIKKTIKRLRKTKRDVKTLYYFTSIDINGIDLLELEFLEEFNVSVRIKDIKYISNHINQNEKTKSSYNLIKHHLNKYETNIRTNFMGNKEVVENSVLIYLRQVLDRGDSDEHLFDLVADSLILWGLEGTDPAKEIFYTKEEIIQKIIDIFPTTKEWVAKKVNKRVKVLSNKNGPKGRLINNHRKEGKFCLPFETREKVKEENISDEKCKDKAKSMLKGRALERNLNGNLEDLDLEIIADVAIKSIEEAYVNNGIDFCHFLNKEERTDSSYFYNIVDTILIDRGYAPKKVDLYKEIVLEIIRDSIYKSSDEEREYFEKLSRTCSLLFVLKSDKKVAQYFERVSENLNLFVGADIIIKAISEKYLPVESQSTRNLIKALSEARVNLYLTEEVLTMVGTHISASHWEFYNKYRDVEQYIKKDLAQSCDRILIRAYLYAKSEKYVHNWNNFLENFLTIENITGKNQTIEALKGELKSYILGQFDMKYLSNTNFNFNDSDESSIQNLKLKFIEDDSKARDAVALSKSTIIHSVYKYRKSQNESDLISPIGSKTWWLTNQVRVLKQTKELVDTNAGVAYNIKPEYVINFIQFSPSLKEIARANNSIFGSILGVKLANRVDPKILDNFLKEMASFSDLDEGRRLTKFEQLSNRLKTEYSSNKYKDDIDEDYE